MISDEMELPRAALTTAQLAQMTGVAPGTLRMWEARHGFPAPSRSGGSHRRYTEPDVEAVRAVLGWRRQGLSMSAAIARASTDRRPPAVSIFAELKARRPELQPMTIAKPALLTLSRAIEDEYCARAATGVLIGSFQTQRFYRQSERRWRELARTAGLAVALAEFDAPRNPRGAPHEVPVGGDHPLAREWSIVFDGHGARGCLAAWEVPDVADTPDRARRFEVLWSPEPEVVSEAVAVAVELIAPLAPPLSARLAALVPDPAASSPELRAATAQAHRMLSYLGGP